MNRNIKAEIARYDLTIEKLAVVLGISTVSMSNKINGKKKWSLSEAKQLVDYFNSLGCNYSIESLFYSEIPEPVKVK